MMMRPGVMSQVKLKLTDGFHFLDLMLAAHCTVLFVSMPPKRLFGFFYFHFSFTIFLRHLHYNQVYMHYVLTTRMVKDASKRYPHVYNN